MYRSQVFNIILVIIDFCCRVALVAEAPIVWSSLPSGTKVLKCKGEYVQMVEKKTVYAAPRGLDESEVKIFRENSKNEEKNENILPVLIAKIARNPYILDAVSDYLNKVNRKM